MKLIRQGLERGMFMTFGEKVKNLRKNSIKCPDGVILTSRHRHDFKSHKDKNGDTYINDGGIDYIKKKIN
jgi:hypothetical protein